MGAPRRGKSTPASTSGSFTAGANTQPDSKLPAWLEARLDRELEESNRHHEDGSDRRTHDEYMTEKYGVPEWMSTEEDGDWR